MISRMKLLIAVRNAVKPAGLAAVLIMMLLIAASCGGEGDPGTVDPGDDDPPNGTDPGGGEPEEVDYAALGVNELGQIMVLMYHRFEETEDEWARTPENFRKDLENLYAEGYRLVSMNDVLDGNIDIPAGTSPVVFTFDDGTAGQFRLIEKDGELVVDPDCAVGIMEEFHREHPDFGLTGTFYIYYVAPPFGQSDYVQAKLEYLVERGFEIGNHTYGHGNLRKLAPEAARKEIAYQVKWTEEYLPGYRVRSLALPLGAHPDDKSLIVQGSFEGIAYHNEGILLVGSNPAPSPFDKRFVPSAIPRIRASEIKTDGLGMYEWMERLRDNPENRYVSDGNPETVVVPEHLAEDVDEARVGSRSVITY